MKQKLVYIIIFTILSGKLYAQKKMDYEIYNLIKPNKYSSLTKNIPKPSYKNKIDLIIKGDNISHIIEEYGGIVNSKINKIYTVSINSDKISDIIKFKNIKYIAAPKHVKLNLNNANSIIHSETAYYYGYTGSKVLVGIVDSGIYFQHSMFKDDAGNTRLLFIWDQTDLSDTGTGSINYKYRYGREWTQWEINSEICTENDNEIGHGTHVAGIAVGNSALHGIAKNANIIFVKTILDTSHIIDAVNYLTDVADKLNKPIVINLSLGNNYGPHDGTDLFSQALSSLTGKGKIIIKAAGNNGKSSEFIHIRINSLSAHASTNIPLSIPQKTITTPGSNFIRMDIWYNGADKIFGSLSTNSRRFLGCSYQNLASASSKYGTVTIFNATYGKDIYNNANELLMIIDDSQNQDLSQLFKCNFTLNFSNTTSTSTSPIDIWVFESSLEAGFSDSDSSYSLDNDSCATDLIVVGATISRTKFTNINNAILSTTSGSLNDIAVFSSQGPTRIGGQKPDISAPGSIILSALVPELQYAYNQYVDHIYSDYLYMQGTSMAAPMVTGAVALLLERNKDLTPNDIIDYFKNHSQTSETYKINPGVWDNKFGWGLLSLQDITTLSQNEPSTEEITLTTNTSGHISIFRNIINLSENNPTILMINESGNYIISIYNMLGEKIYSFDKNNFYKGNVLSWNAIDNNGDTVNTGIYYIVEEKNKIVKKILVKK